MNKMLPFKFLPENEHKHLRIIKFHGKDYNKFMSFIFYLRDFNYEQLDNLDYAILEALNESFIADFQLNTKIIFENQLKEIQNRYKLEEIKDFTIQLSPAVTDSLIKEMQMGRQVYSYPKYFKISFLKGHNFMYLHNYHVAYLDINDLEKLQDTIK
ncbi:hypothetical protein [Chryseobacterium gambrini]|uniref:hypothetical protein n=1 Tax=Chryseobacterium gambrini TaxID=373672 RepID=UPI003D0EAE7B